MKLRILLLTALTITILHSSLFSSDKLARVIKAYKISQKIQLDGLLSEEVWQQADVATDFRQHQPREGEPATERTEVRVLYDEANLYIGVVCFDSEPEKIVAQKLQRDSGVKDDDMFGFLLDTYHDRRNAFLFATNPNGVEEDGQVEDGAFRPNLDWDGVWQVKAKIHDLGWSAEFKIPLWNLRFRRASNQTWGINFTRIIKRKNEQVNWASWSRDNGGFFRISRAGDLTNLVNLEQGFNLQVKPYSLGKTRRDSLLFTHHTGGEKLDAGLDVKYSLASNLTMDLTVNTDFAQVEADVQQINLTRFPLFFPEKREFFLESASIFQFGEAGFFGPPSLLLFFSRRIGIEGFNTIVPIRGGARITGKVSNFNVGFIDMLTDEKAGFPKTHFTVARVSRDIFQRSRIGFIFTNRADFGSSHNQAYGVDANIWLNNSLKFQSFFAQTRTSDKSGGEDAWKLALDYTSDHFGFFLSHLFIDDDFDPRIGFVLRRDIHRSIFAFRISVQPNGAFLRRTNIRQRILHIVNKNGRLQDWSYSITFNNMLNSGDEINLRYERAFERLDVPFDFRPNIQIPTGDYLTNSVNFRFESSAKRRLVGEIRLGWREFYAGNLLNSSGSFGFNFNKHLNLRLRYERNQITLPQGDLTTDLVEFRFNLAFTTHLFLNTLIQYNSESNEFNSNVRLNFIHSPGSDLFVVFNEIRGREGERIWDGLPARNREFIVKFTKFLRI
ncbi:MAG: hypothetical protein D6813_16055 [Calditrichaeota bacterium]|nr:MAG: hypothetical protein D6813_16055 [Calditrichota bacterium]